MLAVFANKQTRLQDGMHRLHAARQPKPGWQQVHFRISMTALCLLFFSLDSLTTRLGQVNPETNHVDACIERVGNPFTDRYSDGEQIYARNVWDMEIFEGRIYLGHGNSSNMPPVPNAGPMQLWVYHPALDQFTVEATLEEEQIDRFIIIGDALYVPGHDSRRDHTFGSFYQLQEGDWQEVRTLANAIHVYDLDAFQGRLYAAVGTDPAVTPYSLAASDDNGKTWEWYSLPSSPRNDLSPLVWRVWELFHVADQLVISAQHTYEAETATGGNLQILRWLSMFRDNGIQLEALNVDFFPPLGVSIPHYRVVRPTVFFDATVYIGAETVNDHQWFPMGLFSITADFTVRQHPLPAGFVPWDVWADDQNLYVLTASQNTGDDGYTILVLSTSNLVDWHEAFLFHAETFARSFLVHEGDFYFGLGSNTDDLAPATGDILRLRRSCW
jgi:hypothetical protein